MSWIRSAFCCCQKRGDSDQHWAKTTIEKDAPSPQAGSSSEAEAEAGRGRLTDPATEKQPPSDPQTGLQYYAHPVYRQGAFGRLRVEDVAGPAEQGESLDTATAAEQLRGHQLVKQRLETVQMERPEIEPKLLQDKQTTQSLKQGKFSESPHNHQCLGMNEVLEMIRDGVSLRHVIKDDFQSDEGSPTSDHAGPELHRILKKRRESSDKYISVSLGQKNPVDTAVEDPEFKHHPGLRRSPRQDDLSGLYQVNKCEEGRDTERDLDAGSCNGDRSSTASPLPLAAALNRGWKDWLLQSSGSESSVGAVDDLSAVGRESPREEWSVCPGLDCIDVEGDYGEDLDPKPMKNCSLSSTHQCLDCGKQSALDLKTTLPLESFRADDHVEHFVEGSRDHEMELSCLATSHVTQTLGCAENVNIPVHPAQFVLVHEIMKPQQVVDGDQVSGRRVFRILENSSGLQHEG